ncbi:hypothetical protein E2C01_049814 [Portunus trituberculatus]|uniref:Uncharacterized protein n=1 Tax=Portunus trituberculatus TaxID=210409 RepID=A0A5B7GE92_PORTR|nr:hypothetical protein [Portunus trituberculatus]
MCTTHNPQVTGHRAMLSIGITGHTPWTAPGRRTAHAAHTRAGHITVTSRKLPVSSRHERPSTLLTKPSPSRNEAKDTKVIPQRQHFLHNSAFVQLKLQLWWYSGGMSQQIPASLPGVDSLYMDIITNSLTRQLPTTTNTPDPSTVSNVCFRSSFSMLPAGQCIMWISLCMLTS